MSKNRIILAVGIILILNPLVGGLPSSWENVIYFVLGLVLIFLSFFVSIKRRTTSPVLDKNKKTSTSEPFVDGFSSGSIRKVSGEPALDSSDQDTFPTNNEQ